MTSKIAKGNSISFLGGTRLAIFIALFLGLSAAVPYYIYQQFGARLPSVDERLVSLPFLAAALAMLLGFYISDGLRLFFTLKSLGYSVPLRSMGALVFINHLFSNITPMATGGGFAQIWYLRRMGIHVGAATAATTLRTLQAAAFIFLPAPFLLMFLGPLQDKPIVDTLAAYLALFAFGYLAFFTIALWKLRWAMALVDGVLQLLVRLRVLDRGQFRHWHYKVRKEMIRFSKSLKVFFRGNPLYSVLSLLCTAGFLLGLLSFPWLLMWGLDYNIDYATTVGLMTVVTFILYFSPTPGGAGIAEGLFSLFFLGLIGRSDLLLIMVGWRFLSIHIGMLAGIPFTLRAVFGPKTGANVPAASNPGRPSP